MRFFSLPISPMNVLPKSRQFQTVWFVLAGFLALSGILVVSSWGSGDWFSVAECMLSAAAAVYHVCVFSRKALQSVMSFFPTTCLLVLIRLLMKLIGIPSRFEDGTGSPLTVFLVIEFLFWIGFCVCTYFALMGRAKLILPLVMLLFAFFYIFVEVEFRNFLEIARLILFLLLLWLPIDAVSFSSSPERFGKNKLE